MNTTNEVLSSSYNESQKQRSKTPLRMKYEAEVSVLREQIGSLEDVRHDLGLSRRKMCQLLMVDPSAWTRWLKDEDKVPPHIWRSLQWYLALLEKRPEWRPQQLFYPHPKSIDAEAEIQKQKEAWQREKSAIMDLLKNLNTETEEIRGQLRRFKSADSSQEQIGVLWKLLLLINMAFLLYFMVFN